MTGSKMQQTLAVPMCEVISDGQHALRKTAQKRLLSTRPPDSIPTLNAPIATVT